VAQGCFSGRPTTGGATPTKSGIDPKRKISWGVGGGGGRTNGGAWPKPPKNLPGGGEVHHLCRTINIPWEEKKKPKPWGGGGGGTPKGFVPVAPFYPKGEWERGGDCTWARTYFSTGMSKGRGLAHAQGVRHSMNRVMGGVKLTRVSETKKNPTMSRFPPHFKVFASSRVPTGRGPTWYSKKTSNPTAPEKFQGGAAQGDPKGKGNEPEGSGSFGKGPLALFLKKRGFSLFFDRGQKAVNQTKRVPAGNEIARGGKPIHARRT